MDKNRLDIVQVVERPSAHRPALFTGSRDDGAEICFSRAFETGAGASRLLKKPASVIARRA
jgi:hypothetical protein